MGRWAILLVGSWALYMATIALLTRIVSRVEGRWKKEHAEIERRLRGDE